MKHKIGPVLLLAVLVAMPGCGNGKVAEKPCLTVCMEEVTVQPNTTSPRPDLFIKDLARMFSADEAGLDVEVTEIPSAYANGGEAGREAYIQRTRVEMSAGNGPDIFILPTVSFNGEHSLIESVEKSMASGLFADLSAYAGDDPDFASCNSQVMDAGLYNEKRYAVPLQYTYPLMIALKEEIEKTDLDLDRLESSYSAFLEEAAKPPELWWRRAAAEFIYSTFYCGFSGAVDYKNQKLFLTEEDVTGNLTKYASVSKGIVPRTPEEIPLAYGKYAYGEMKLTPENPIYVVYGGTPSNALIALAELKDSGDPYLCLPLPDSEGLVTPQVTYFAAVSASCEEPEKAYDFIKLLLTEEVQSGGKCAIGGESADAGDLCLLYGWPVRKNIAIEELWETFMADRFITDEKLILLSDGDVQTDASRFNKGRFSSQMDTEFKQMLFKPYSDRVELTGSTLREIAGHMYRRLRAEAME